MVEMPSNVYDFIIDIYYIGAYLTMQYVLGKPKICYKK